MTDLNLTHLRAVAEAATQGEWKKRSVSLPLDIRASGLPVAEVYDDEDAAFVTTFSPPTVLALITRAEKAEAALEEARASAFDEAAKMIENRLGVSSIAKQLIGALRAAAADTGARVAQGRK